MVAFISSKSCLLALLTINTSLAFVPSKGLAARRNISVGRFMAGDEEGDWIKTVNSKEIFFDEKMGRFFETKKGYEEDKGEGEVSGPFSANPFKKPKGTFFKDLQTRKEEEPKPASPKTKETSGFSLDSIFKRQEEPAAPVAPPVPVSAAVSKETSDENSPLSFLGDLFKPKQAPPVPVSAEVSKETSDENSPLDFLGDLFKPKQGPLPEETEPVYCDPITISNDFRVAGAFLAAAYLLDQIPFIQLTLGPLVTLLGGLFLFQSFRIRFIFNEQNELELVNVKNILTGELESSGENVVVGGGNVWACDAIVNYDFFPPIDSSPVGPILVYFKETQTDPQFWNDGPGLLANKEGKIKSGEVVAGQVHFFPAVCNAEQIRDEFEKRGCGKL
jgi:hypothetical protein